jgi:hypothetical protein
MSSSHFYCRSTGQNYQPAAPAWEKTLLALQAGKRDNPLVFPPAGKFRL